MGLGKKGPITSGQIKIKATALKVAPSPVVMKKAIETTKVRTYGGNKSVRSFGGIPAMKK